MTDKPHKTISLACPTCGNEQFEHDQQSNICICSDCGLKLTHDELKEANFDRIQTAVDEVKKEVMDDLTKTLKKSFSKWK